jgi:hypothetical protein
VGPLARWLKTLGRFGTPVIALLAVACLLYGLLPVSEALWAETLGVEGAVSTGEWPPPHAGTSLEADKTATGFYEDGEYGVRGDICVSNVGERTTQGLAIIDQVQFKVPGHDGFQDLEGASVEIEVPTELDPGEAECYSYEIILAPVEGAKAYRNVARVTITNHSGHVGQPFGPEPKASFSLPLDQDDDDGDDDDQDEDASAAHMPVFGGVTQEGLDWDLTCTDYIKVAGWGFNWEDYTVTFVRFDPLPDECEHVDVFVRIVHMDGDTILADASTLDPPPTTPVSTSTDWRVYFPPQNPEDIGELQVRIEGADIHP